MPQKDFNFIMATYETFKESYGEDDLLSWKVVGQTIDSSCECVCVIGAFDGFHRGHRTLLDRARAIADERHMKLVVCMFDPDPAIFFNPQKKNEELLTSEERISLLMNAGADSCICFRFDANMASMDYKEFLDRLRSIVQLKELCVGYDFKLGAQGRGTFDKIVDYAHNAQFKVYGVDLMQEDVAPGVKISSTTIRKAIMRGDVRLANVLLGHFALVDGEVKHGRGEGTSFGYPTANILCSTRRVAPSNGVFAAWVSNGEKLWPSALHVGLPPTFNEKDARINNWLLEAFLLDCNEDLYGQQLRVFFVDKIGDTQKFESFDALERALQGYIVSTENLLGKSLVIL